MGATINGLKRQITEWHYISSKARKDPFNEIQLDVIITDEEGNVYTIPAFWGGEQEWRVRFSAPKPGVYKAVTRCSDTNDHRLHHVKTTLHIADHKSLNPLYKYGSLQIADTKSHFEHEDGTAFLWMGDTWWMGLCKRLSYPEEFSVLTKDRVEKGFTVIQIVAGLYPDMDSFDERGQNEAGFPWEKEYSTINPAYFDMADLRIQSLIRSGLVPCILGAWGYYLLAMGTHKMKQHWRYIIARWGAYPVIWSIAGEANMPFYRSKDIENDKKKLKEGWTAVGQYIKQIDPYSRLLTVHPSQVGRNEVKETAFMDFDMLQTGHSGYESVHNTVTMLQSELKREPVMPVVASEVNYEGILHGNDAEMQRLTFWSAILSGASGFTYGANGVWQVNQVKKPFGKSPHGGNWGTTPWSEAYKFHGSTQLGLAVKLLKCYAWWKFEQHPEWISTEKEHNLINTPFAAGIPGKVRIVYTYNPDYPWISRPFKITDLEPNISYEASFWNPRNGDKTLIGIVTGNEDNEWETPMLPTFEDWVLILEA